MVRGYAGSMSAVLRVRDLPEGTRRTLRARAAARGESLNSDVLHVLAREAARPTVAEVLERAAARSEHAAIPSAEIIAAARAERDEGLVRRAPTAAPR